MKIYTGIGSRETPYEIQGVMWGLASELAKDGWTLRSGAAPGADSAFERGALHDQGKMEIYLPWSGFENRHGGLPYYVADTIPGYWEAEQIAAQFHPAWNRLKQGARKLHTRNVYQVVGRSLTEPSDMILCWTKDGLRGGGTGQALRINAGLIQPIPVFDLAICSVDEIVAFVNTKYP